MKPGARALDGTARRSRCGASSTRRSPPRRPHDRARSRTSSRCASQATPTPSDSPRSSGSTEDGASSPSPATPRISSASPPPAARCSRSTTSRRCSGIRFGALRPAIVLVRSHGLTIALAFECFEAHVRVPPEAITADEGASAMVRGAVVIDGAPAPSFSSLPSSNGLHAAPARLGEGPLIVPNNWTFGKRLGLGFAVAVVVLAIVAFSGFTRARTASSRRSAGSPTRSRSATSSPISSRS